MTVVPVPEVPGAEDFRALARSSPWRFTTVHFTTVHFTHHRARGGAEADGAVEAWLDRRAGRVTVRSARGVEVAEGAPYSVSRVTSVTASSPDDAEPDPSPGAAAAAQNEEPIMRPDGLVAERPGDWHIDHGDPMWRDYQWTAMLDPAELSTGVQIDDVAATTRRGRPTWSATCRPLMGRGEDWDGGYDPRCGCCPLLDSTASRLPEYGPDDAKVHTADLPTTYVVQLDVQTAMAVQIDAVDGWAGTVLSNEIHGVDEPLAPPHPWRSSAT